MGTFILATLFSAYVVWSVHVTKMFDEDAKNLGYTHKGKVLGMKYYLVLPDDEGLFSFCGGNVLTDTLLVAIIPVGISLNGGEFSAKVEEIK